MPIDKTMSDAMLGAFRTMVAGCKDQGHSGEAFDNMCRIMDEMETLAMEMSDFSAFNAKLTTGGYFVNFSNEYAKLLSAAATSQYSQGGAAYNDTALLEQTLKAYEDCLPNYLNHKDKETLTKAVQDVINLGRSGVNYPTFLRLMIEQGLDKAMEGTIVNRKYLLADVAFYEELIHPPMLRRSKAVLSIYDELAATASFGVPNTVVYILEHSKILDDTEAGLRKYEHLQQLWIKLIMGLHLWVDAYTKYAPADERYAGGSAEMTRQNIERYKNVWPGKIKIWEAQLLDNYGLCWNDIFTHESFDAEHRSGRFNYTSDCIRFIKDEVYTQCSPLQHAGQELIAKAEALYGKSLTETP
ncbi:MAG: hypothetical protein ABIX01_15850 [Chitinophagaceae bacterium]